MGLRFRRTLKLFPGVRLNVSRSGVSTTLGVRGASVTVGKKGTYANVGLPGSGVSYRTKVGPGVEEALEAPHHEETPRRRSLLPTLLVAILLIGGGVAVFQVLPKPPAAPVPIAASFQPIPAEKAPLRETVQISKRSTTIRAEASRKSDKLGTAHQGDTFTVFAHKGVWLQIGHEAPEGWIAASATKS